MENLITRYRNVSILAVILFVQVLGLAVQVKRSGADESTRLIRLWTINTVTPLEKAIVWCQGGLGNIWNNYIYLRGVRQENRDLKFEIERLRLGQVRLADDAHQARRLQALLAFKEQYISTTVAAQVIGSSGSEKSRLIYIDKGAADGVEKDMAVITADGVVGKVLLASGSTAQVLLINDSRSGVGVILDKSRLQGVVKGSATGDLVLENVMTDNVVSPGELVVTSGGDQIFPKGHTIGIVTKVSPGADLFLNIRVKPSINLSSLEEVLVITKREDRAPSIAESGSERAVDILSRRLPSVPDKPAADPNKPPASGTPSTTKPPTIVPKPLASGEAPETGSVHPVSPKPQGEASVTEPGNVQVAKSARQAAAKPASSSKPAPAAGKASEATSNPVQPAPADAGPNQPAPEKPVTSEDKPQ
jgi:rod shape-determining protein MreC